MKEMIDKKKCPDIWKIGKTIMLSKGGDTTSPVNGRPITLTSLLYRDIFGRIEKEFMKFDNKEDITIFSKEQKGFVPGIGGCSQYAFVANMAISHVISERRQLYVLA
jgi:hypothetical protein